jgi:hypothetical protein
VPHEPHLPVLREPQTDGEPDITAHGRHPRSLRCS